METTEKKKPFKDEETKIIQLGPATSPLQTVSGSEDVKSIETGRERRSRKQCVIVRRDDDDDYR